MSASDEVVSLFSEIRTDHDLIIESLPVAWTEIQLSRVIADVAQVSRVRIAAKNNKITTNNNKDDNNNDDDSNNNNNYQTALVEFTSDEEARRAKQHFHGREIDGCALIVTWARQREYDYDQLNKSSNNNSNNNNNNNGSSPPPVSSSGPSSSSDRDRDRERDRSERNGRGGDRSDRGDRGGDRSDRINDRSSHHHHSDRNKRTSSRDPPSSSHHHHHSSSSSTPSVSRSAVIVTREVNPFPPGERSPNIFISGFPPHWDEGTLKKECQRYGDVERCTIWMKDNRPSDSGYVLFRTVDEAERAVKALDNQRLPGCGGPMVVRYAPPPKNKRERTASPRRAGSRERPPRKGPATSIPYYPNYSVSHIPPTAFRNDGSLAVYCYNLPFDVTDADLINLFSHYGRVRSVALGLDSHGHKRGFAFVNMESPQESDNAIRYLNNYPMGERLIKVEYKMEKKEKERIMRLDNDNNNNSTNSRSSNNPYTVHEINRGRVSDRSGGGNDRNRSKSRSRSRSRGRRFPATSVIDNNNNRGGGRSSRSRSPRPLSDHGGRSKSKERRRSSRSPSR